MICFIHSSMCPLIPCSYVALYLQLETFYRFKTLSGKSYSQRPPKQIHAIYSLHCYLASFQTSFHAASKKKRNVQVHSPSHLWKKGLEGRKEGKDGGRGREKGREKKERKIKRERKKKRQKQRWKKRKRDGRGKRTHKKGVTRQVESVNPTRAPGISDSVTGHVFEVRLKGMQHDWKFKTPPAHIQWNIIQPWKGREFWSMPNTAGSWKHFTKWKKPHEDRYCMIPPIKRYLE